MLRLLIVDDEQIIRESLSQLIDYESLGYELIGASKNGMDAYDVICDEYPDVVITDIKMPILDGLELIERVRKSDSHVAFILLSGYGEFEYAKQAMKYGVKYYLLKPTSKQELIEALQAVEQNFRKEELRLAEQQTELLRRLRRPLEQCFFMEALESPEKFAALFSKYHRSLPFETPRLAACICSFVEEPYLDQFCQDAASILEQLNLPLEFSMLYVKNTLILLAPFHSGAVKEILSSRLCRLRYPEQSVSFQTSFLEAPDGEGLFSSVIAKLSRFERILLIQSVRPFEPCEIHNHLTSPWKIRQIAGRLADTENYEAACAYLDSVLPDSQPLDTSKIIAMELFLSGSQSEGNAHALFSAGSSSDFLSRIYSCASAGQLRSLLRVILPRTKATGASKGNQNISLLKEYVSRHLDSENLSLKWLAENYLFVSVGYLSKQFIKEEGVRFSEYLNKKRMDAAVCLMINNHSANIKSIASQVGFGNNSQYFSQVFKKYTGCTPSEYIENNQLN